LTKTPIHQTQKKTKPTQSKTVFTSNLRTSSRELDLVYVYYSICITQQLVPVQADLLHNDRSAKLNRQNGNVYWNWQNKCAT